MATKSVLSQSASMQSSSAMALGSLMNKSGASKSGASKSGAGGSKGPSATGSVLSQAAPQTSEAAKALGAVGNKRADATKSVLSQAPGMQSSSAMALGALVNKGGGGPSKREGGAPQNSEADGGRRPPEATKSVLAQGAPQTSAAAQALGALSNQRADATKSVLSQGPAPTSAAAAALGSLSNQRADATKSVLSQGPAPTSAAAAALGSLSNQRANATKSVLSQGPATTSAAASALGSLSNQRPRAAPPVQAGPTRDESEVNTAALPTRAEDQNRGYNARPQDSGFMPLLAPDDDNQMRYKDALPQNIRVEHDGGSKRSSWMCCSGGNDGSQVDMISKPRNVSTLSKHLVVGIQQPESQGPWRQLIQRSLTGAHLECTTCTKEIVQEISAV